MAEYGNAFSACFVRLTSQQQYPYKESHCFKQTENWTFCRGSTCLYMCWYRHTLMFFCFQGAIHCMAFSSDGRYLASAGNEIRVYIVFSYLHAFRKFILNIVFSSPCAVRKILNFQSCLLNQGMQTYEPSLQCVWIMNGASMKTLSLNLSHCKM